MSIKLNYDRLKRNKYNSDIYRSIANTYVNRIVGQNIRRNNEIKLQDATMQITDIILNG